MAKQQQKVEFDATLLIISILTFFVVKTIIVLVCNFVPGLTYETVRNAVLNIDPTDGLLLLGLGFFTVVNGLRSC